MASPYKPRLLVFIVAFNAEKTIAKVIGRIPNSLLENYDVEVLIIDDASADGTFEESHFASKRSGPIPIRILYNPVNQGYGGNQKLGYHFALREGFDYVALIHGDGQYAPECLPQLLEPLQSKEAAAVFGSRMLTPSGALSGGMPVYKYVGNKILTWLENRLLRTNLSEFHSGYRIYSTRALASIPFDRNSNDFHFDTEIIIQLLIAGQPIAELPIPTYYGDEICRVNGVKYAWNVIVAATRARLQSLGLFYDRRYDCAPPNASLYFPKFTYTSPHTLALQRVPAGSRVLDIGCAGGYMGAALAREKHCSVDGVDTFPAVEPGLSAFWLHDLNSGLPDLPFEEYDVVLMLDVLEHLSKPEAFLEELRRALKLNPQAEVIMSTANIGFFIPRIMLALGFFNYGRRGILDLTHTRLFTFASFRRAVLQAGFDVVETRGVPGPFPLALGDNFLSRLLLAVNRGLIRISRGLFSYQIFMRLKPQPSLELLLHHAEEETRQRVELMRTAGSER